MIKTVLGFTLVLNNFNHNIDLKSYISRTFVVYFRYICGVRKTASIFLAILVLLTGIHLSISSHFCCGQLAAVKVSVIGKSASCGMEGNASATLPAGKVIKSHCCANELTTLSVDSNYSPSFAKNVDILQKVTPINGALLIEIDKSLTFVKNPYPILSPPGICQMSAVELEEICIFRI
jgi:hypothetical protein